MVSTPWRRPAARWGWGPRQAVARAGRRSDPVKGRFAAGPPRRWQAEVTLVDASHNANPDSVRAAIDQLTQLPASLAGAGGHGRGGRPGLPSTAKSAPHARERGISHACGSAAKPAGTRPPRRREGAAGSRMRRRPRSRCRPCRSCPITRGPCWSRVAPCTEQSHRGVGGQGPICHASCSA